MKYENLKYKFVNFIGTHVLNKKQKNIQRSHLNI